MILKLAILAVIGLTLTDAQTPDDRCPLVNTRPPTHVAHETDCRLFYLCHLGSRYIMPPCPSGHLFDPAAVPTGCRPSSQDPATCVPSTDTPTTVLPPTDTPTTVETPTEIPTTVLPEEETTVPNVVPTAPIQVPTAPTEAR